MLKRLCS
jgi:hypothetical protein